jgi:WhiB family transcriptional regulator, redox-sensing transcriptional regulator
VSVMERADDWRRRAACLGESPETFFPARGDNRGRDRALEFCERCEVKSECLAEHLFEGDGIYGGTSARIRKRMRSTLKRVRKCEYCKQSFETSSSALTCSQRCRDRRKAEYKKSRRLLRVVEEN